MRNDFPIWFKSKAKQGQLVLECKNLCNFSSVFGGTLLHSQSVISCVQEVPVLKNETHAGAGILSPQNGHCNLNFKKRLCHFFIEVTPMEVGSSSIPRWAGTYFQSFPLLSHYPILNSTLKRNNCRVRPSSGAGTKIRGLGQGSSQVPPGSTIV